MSLFIKRIVALLFFFALFSGAHAALVVNPVAVSIATGPSSWDGLFRPNSGNSNRQLLGSYTINAFASGNFSTPDNNNRIVIGTQTFHYNNPIDTITDIVLVDEFSKVVAGPVNADTSGTFVFLNVPNEVRNRSYYLFGITGKKITASPIISTKPCSEWVGARTTSTAIPAQPLSFCFSFGTGLMLMYGPRIAVAPPVSGIGRLELFAGDPYFEKEQIFDQTKLTPSERLLHLQTVGTYTVQAGFGRTDNRCVVDSEVDMSVSDMRLKINTTLGISSTFSNCKIFDPAGNPLTAVLPMTSADLPIHFTRPLAIRKGARIELYAKCSVTNTVPGDSFSWDIPLKDGAPDPSAVIAVGVGSDGFTVVDPKPVILASQEDQTNTIDLSIPVEISASSNPAVSSTPVVAGTPNQSLGSFVFIGDDSYPFVVGSQSFRYAAGSFLSATAPADSLTGITLVSSTGALIAGPVNATKDGTFTFTNVSYPAGSDAYTLKGTIGKSITASPVITTTPSKHWTATRSGPSNLAGVLTTEEMRMTGPVLVTPIAVSVAASTLALPTVLAGTPDQKIASFTTPTTNPAFFVANQSFKYAAGAFLAGSAPVDALSGLTIVSATGAVLAGLVNASASGVFTFTNVTYPAGAGTYFIRGTIAKGFTVTPVVTTTPSRDWTGASAVANSFPVALPATELRMTGSPIVTPVTVSASSVTSVGVAPVRVATPSQILGTFSISSNDGSPLNSTQFILEKQAFRYASGAFLSGNAPADSLTNVTLVSSTVNPNTGTAVVAGPVNAASDGTFTFANVSYGSAATTYFIKGTLAKTFASSPLLITTTPSRDWTGRALPVGNSAPVVLPTTELRIANSSILPPVDVTLSQASVALPAIKSATADQSFAAFSITVGANRANLPLRVDQTFRYATAPFLTGKTGGFFQTVENVSGMSLVSSTGKVMSRAPQVYADGTFTFIDVTYPVGTGTYYIKGRTGAGFTTSPIITITPSRDSNSSNYPATTDFSFALPSTELRLTGPLIK